MCEQEWEEMEQGLATIFIRHGIWCECEKSCNSATGQLESGLSVYYCKKANGNTWSPLGQAWKKNGSTVWNSPTPWFLVEGKSTGAVGGDREPLIIDVKAKKCLEWDNTQKVFVELECDSPLPRNHKTHPKC